MKYVVIMLSAILCSCASQFGSSAENAYLNSRNGAYPVITAPLTSSNLSHFYDLPQEEAPVAVTITPPSA